MSETSVLPCPQCAGTGPTDPGLRTETRLSLSLYRENHRSGVNTGRPGDGETGGAQTLGTWHGHLTTLWGLEMWSHDISETVRVWRFDDRECLDCGDVRM